MKFWIWLKKWWFGIVLVLASALFWVWGFVTSKKREELEKELREKRKLERELKSAIEREKRRSESREQMDQEIQESVSRYSELLEKEQSRIENIQEELNELETSEVVENLKDKLRSMK